MGEMHVLGLLRLLGSALLFLAAACGPGSVAPPSRPSPTQGSASQPSETPTPGQPATSPPAVTPLPVFKGTIARIDETTKARMTSSWHPGCPVPIEDLRLLSLTYWGFDGRTRTGEVVVHRDVAADVVGVFEQLFDARFPIRRMRLIDDYGGNDDRSMAANN